MYISIYYKYIIIQPNCQKVIFNCNNFETVCGFFYFVFVKQRTLQRIVFVIDDLIIVKSVLLYW